MNPQMDDQNPPIDLPDDFDDIVADLERAEEDQIERVGQLQTEIDDLKNQLLRSYADLQNFRRRSLQQQDETRKFAIESFARDLLPVLDNFERTMVALRNGADVAALTEGVSMVQKLLSGVLEQHGVNRVASTGAEFDPEVHEAITTSSDPALADGQIAEELESGYTLAGRVLRPARVRVNRNA